MKIDTFAVVLRYKIKRKGRGNLRAADSPSVFPFYKFAVCTGCHAAALFETLREIALGGKSR